jgi:hypothetical protein
VVGVVVPSMQAVLPYARGRQYMTQMHNLENPILVDLENKVQTQL